MATCTAPIGQSLFDFLDGKSGVEKLEALRNGALGREINRYVQTRLEHLQIGSLQNPPQPSLWGSQPWTGSAPTPEPGPAVSFQQGNRPLDLVGDCTRISGPEDNQAGLGGIDSDWSHGEHPTAPIFRSHRSS